MARTNIDVDDRAVRIVMQRFGLPTMRAAVNYALQRLADEAATREEALELEGSGWSGDLDELRSGRTG